MLNNPKVGDRVQHITTRSYEPNFGSGVVKHFECRLDNGFPEPEKWGDTEEWIQGRRIGVVLDTPRYMPIYYFHENEFEYSHTLDWEDWTVEEV